MLAELNPMPTDSRALTSECGLFRNPRYVIVFALIQ